MADEVNHAYDLIIVGAGTAGCVLANRLSEDPNLSILVLEAGEDRNGDERIYTPALMGSVYCDSAFDWDYTSQPEPGLNHRIINHPRGRLVGGTSAINSLALIYPSATGIDAWEELGIEGWNWKTLAPYFRKFQTIVPPNQKVKDELNIAHNDENIRGSRGPIQASFPLGVTALQKAWDDTFRTLGLQNDSDPLDGHSIGGHTSTCHVTGDRRERSHSGNAYLTPVLSRDNLTLITGARVTKLLIEQREDGPIVTGVSYAQKGISRQVSAKKEAILAAGVFNSPQILELSGIGDLEVLHQHGIDVVSANPAVGENLQDHIRPRISFEVTDDTLAQIPMPAEEARKLYEQDRSGPWASSGAFSFSYTPLAPFLDEDEMRDLKTLVDERLSNERHYSAFERRRNDFVRNMILSPLEASAVSFMAKKPATDVLKGSFLTMSAMLSHPLSAGSTHITSSDPCFKPKIAFNYYSNPLDLEIHARQVQILQKIAKTEPLASYIKPGGRQLPAGYSLESVDGAKDLCRAHAFTNYHPCGTCSLGAVVDSRLKVKGVKNLRVVDASVMPIIPRGNIITTVYAIAERGADILSEDLSARRNT